MNNSAAAASSSSSSSTSQTDTIRRNRSRNNGTGTNDATNGTGGENTTQFFYYGQFTPKSGCFPPQGHTWFDVDEDGQSELGPMLAHNDPRLLRTPHKYRPMKPVTTWASQQAQTKLIHHSPARPSSSSSSSSPPTKTIHIDKPLSMTPGATIPKKGTINIVMNKKPDTAVVEEVPEPRRGDDDYQQPMDETSDEEMQSDLAADIAIMIQQNPSNSEHLTAELLRQTTTTKEATAITTTTTPTATALTTDEELLSGNDDHIVPGGEEAENK